MTDATLKVLHADLYHVATLERAGCLLRGAVTPLGQRVGIVLRNVHGFAAWSRSFAVS